MGFIVISVLEKMFLKSNDWLITSIVLTIGNMLGYIIAKLLSKFSIKEHDRISQAILKLLPL